ncbi:MAG: LacI family DNA-binding transcriptional regulator [Phycisphaeraceae bacterium JB051]
MSVSQYDIAKAAGVSQRAVSFALNGKPNVSKEKREKIIRMAQKMGYRPNASARAMQSRSTGTIGVLAQHYVSEEAMIAGINQKLQQAGYYTMIEQYGGVLKLDANKSRLLLERVVDGLIILNADDSVTQLVDNQFSNLSSQMVWLESSHLGSTGCIRRDEDAVTEHACNCLKSKGYDRVLYIERHAGLEPGRKQFPYTGGIHYSCLARHLGMQSHAQQVGLQFNWIDSNLRLEPLTSQQLSEHLDLKRGDRVAVVGYDFWVAEWVYRRLLKLGLDCPDDYGLLSLDEHRQFKTANIWPELSYYKFDRHHAGHLAGQMVLDLLKKQTPCPSHLFGPEFIEGQTL